MRFARFFESFQILPNLPFVSGRGLDPKAGLFSYIPPTNRRKRRLSTTDTTRTKAQIPLSIYVNPHKKSSLFFIITPLYCAIKRGGFVLFFGVVSKI